MNPVQALRFPADSTGFRVEGSVRRKNSRTPRAKSQERIGKTLLEPQRVNPQYHGHRPQSTWGGGVRQGETWPPAKGIQTETRLLAEATQEDQAFKRQLEELVTITGSEDAKTEDYLGKCSV